MKQFILTTMAALAIAPAFAQTTLWDGENLDIDTEVKGWADSHRPVGTVVDNPEKDGVNTSAKCIKYSYRSVSDEWDYVIETGGVSLGSAYRVSLMIKRDGIGSNVNVEFAGLDQKRAAWYGGDGKWQKIVFDLSGYDATKTLNAIGINAATDDIGTNVDIYIDNVVIEPIATVNGTALSSIDDSSLSGKVTLTGSWMKGDCQNTNGNWVKIEYNDFTTLATKMTSEVTSVVIDDDAVLKDAYNAFSSVNPNIIIYSSQSVDGDNVVVSGKATTVNLNENYNFDLLQSFTAETVNVSSERYAGYNTLYLPFAVTKDELGGTIATFKEKTSGDDAVVKFVTADNVEANTPMLLSLDADNSDAMAFTNKTFVVPTTSAASTFVGTYSIISPATNMWGIGSDNKFVQGGESSTMNAFHAYLTSVNSAKAISIEMETTGISDVQANEAQAVDVYTLGGVLVRKNVAASAATIGLKSGIYLVNGKKLSVR